MGSSSGRVEMLVSRKKKKRLRVTSTFPIGFCALWRGKGGFRGGWTHCWEALTKWGKGLGLLETYAQNDDDRTNPLSMILSTGTPSRTGVGRGMINKGKNPQEDSQPSEEDDQEPQLQGDKKRV